MERLAMSNNTNMIKDHSNIGGGSNTGSSSWNTTSTITTTADHHHHHRRHQPDYLQGFSWPPRSYTCSFCKREFRSAQALGGHMNVHRRDRARLRQYSPPPLPPTRDHYPILNLNVNPNPNPNNRVVDFSSSPPPSPSGKWAEGAVRVDPSARFVPDHLGKVGTRKSLFGGEYCDHGLIMGHRDGVGGGKLRKRGGGGEMMSNIIHNGNNNNSNNDNDNVSLELEIGVVSQSKKEQLDLELRL